MKSKILLRLYKSLFRDQPSQIAGEEVPLRRTKGLRNFRMGKYLFIEQNPRKQTRPAKLARQGHKIAWLINTETREYLYLIRDGKVIRL